MLRAHVLKKSLLLTILSITLGFTTLSLAAEDLKVATSIKPLHSLVSAVMSGVGEPTLIIQGHVSPHDHILRPSDMRTLQNSDVVFFIDETLETSMGTAVQALDESIDVIALMTVDNIQLLEWDGAHSHGDDPEEHDDHDDHAVDESTINTSLYDHHIWLDPVNAVHMTKAIVQVLSSHDEENAELFSDNAEELIQEIEEMTKRLSASFDSVTTELKPFIVYHDGYQSFEHRFGLDGLTNAFVKGEHTPGARHIQQLQRNVSELNIECVFTEPQFDDDFLDALEDTDNLKIRTLDPLGANLTPGPKMYTELIENISSSLLDCLAEATD